jgi:3-mercaptopyruvate sulfurtransferase SseA
MIGNQRRIFGIVLVIAGGLLLVVAVLIGLNSGQTTQPPAIVSATPTEIAIADIQRVSLADSKTAFDQQKAVFVDVRDAQSYASGHIQNAISIPLAEMTTGLTELKTSDWIITVCT